MVVAIDGPAGAGKSTVARAVADRLGYTYLDTGAMYRSVALAALERGEHPAAVAPTLRIEPTAERVMLDGRDVTVAIRTPEVSEAASKVAAEPAVRAAMVAEQRRLLHDGNWVAEGRDIGTVVAPGRRAEGVPHRGSGGARSPPRRRARRRRADCARRAAHP